MHDPSRAGGSSQCIAANAILEIIKNSLSFDTPGPSIHDTNLGWYTTPPLSPNCLSTASQPSQAQMSRSKSKMPEGKDVEWEKEKET
jgi:hypothetical protein